MFKYLFLLFFVTIIHPMDDPKGATEYTSQNIKDAFGYDIFERKLPLDIYLNRLHKFANLLAIQDEFASLFTQNEIFKSLNLAHDNDTPNKPTSISSDEKLSEEDTYNQHMRKGLLLGLKQMGITFETPDGIVATFQAADSRKSKDFINFFQNHEKSNHPEIQILVTELKKVVNLKALEQEEQYSNKIQSLEEYFLKENGVGIKALGEYKENKFVQPIKNFLMDTAQQIGNFTTAHKAVLSEAPQTDFATSKDFKLRRQVQSLPIGKMDDFGKKSENNKRFFLDAYKELRPSICNYYEAIRKEIRTLILKNRQLLHFSQKNFSSLDTTSSLPNKLPATLNSEQNTPKTEDPIPTNVEKSIEDNSKQKIKKNKCGYRKNWTLEASPAQPALQEKGKQKETDTIEKIVHNPVIKPNTHITCVTDALNKIKLYAYLSIKPKRKIEDFSYHPRIYEWLKDPAKALEHQGYNNPDNPKYGYRNNAVAYHGFSIDIDKYMREYGIVKEKTARNGKPTHFVALPGHIEKNDKTKFVIYGYAIDPEKKICYHRCIEERTSQDLLNEYLSDQSWKITLEELQE